MALATGLAACRGGDDEPAEPPAAVSSAPGRGPRHAREPLLHVPVPEKVREGAGRFAADWSFDLLQQPSWSAHVHVIPEGQLVPLHRHPENDELAWVGAGHGEWESRSVEERPPRPDGAPGGLGPLLRSWTLRPGDAVVTPKGAAHQVRNRQPEPLAVLVVQRPRFAQNWYLLPDEVNAPLASWLFGPGGGAPPESPRAFEGWGLDWLSSDALLGERPGEGSADRLLLWTSGIASLLFENKHLPLEPGTFVRIPPGLPFSVEGGPAPGAELRALLVTVPR
jgi:mannose-6-phosphate isomerase-like protein (cupin superfamily)